MMQGAIFHLHDNLSSGSEHKKSLAPPLVLLRTDAVSRGWRLSAEERWRRGGVGRPWVIGSRLGWEPGLQPKSDGLHHNSL